MRARAKHEISDQSVTYRTVSEHERKRSVRLLRMHTWALKECERRAKHEISDQSVTYRTVSEHERKRSVRLLRMHTWALKECERKRSMRLR